MISTARLVLVAVTFVVSGRAPSQSDESPARHVPANVDLYVEMTDLRGLVDELPSSPVVATLRETGVLDELEGDGGFEKITEVFSLLSRLVAGRVGLSLRLQPSGPRFLLAARRRGGLTHEELIEKLACGLPDVEVGDADEIAGASVIELGKGGVAAGRDEWFFWSTNPFHLRRALRLAADESLAATDRYRRMMRAKTGAAFALCARPASLLAKQGDAMTTDEPLGILLFQGLLDDLRSAKEAFAWGRFVPWPALDVHILRDAPREDWSAAGPGARRWIAPRDDDIACVCIDRDLAGFWRLRHEILPESTHQGLARFTQTMNVFLSGFPFDDVMKHVKPGAQILAAPQHLTGEGLPEIRLPSFALVLRTDLDRELRDRMRVAFQTTIGVVNAGAAEEKRQPMLQLSREVGGVEILGTRFLSDPRDGRKAIEYNLSPSLAFVGSTLVLSSTLPFAEKLVRRLADGGTETDAGDRISLDGPGTVRALRLNSSVLAEEMMLEDGIALEEAERRVGALLDAVSRIETLDVSHVDEKQVSRWSLRIAGREGDEQR